MKWLTLPENFQVEPNWIYGGLEAKVDVAIYTRHSHPDVRWCEYLYTSPGSASVYPVKLAVPGRGEGQFKFAEILEWRYLADVLDALVELDRTRGIRPEHVDREGSALPPGIDPKWAWGATEYVGSRATAARGLPRVR